MSEGAGGEEEAVLWGGGLEPHAGWELLEALRGGQLRREAQPEKGLAEHREEPPGGLVGPEAHGGLGGVVLLVLPRKGLRNVQKLTYRLTGRLSVQFLDFLAYLRHILLHVLIQQLITDF